MNTFLKVLFALFLAICIGVHVYGLVTRFSGESNASHVTHLVSYSLCLFVLLANRNTRFKIYLIGALYPFFYHANCAWNTFQTHHTLNGICLLVVVLLPLIGWFIAKQNRSAFKQSG
jgi:hypothetical protein